MNKHFLMWATAIALAAPAAAQWQSTTWGMSPAQVVAASKGEARLGKGRDGQRLDDVPRTLEVIGTSALGTHPFETAYYFLGGTRLKLIKMKQLDAPQGCAPLIADLRRTHGPPTDVDRETVLIFTGWDDPARNTRMTTMQIGRNYCSLEFEPLDEALEAESE